MDNITDIKKYIKYITDTLINRGIDTDDTLWQDNNNKALLDLKDNKITSKINNSESMNINCSELLIIAHVVNKDTDFDKFNSLICSEFKHKKEEIKKDEIKTINFLLITDNIESRIELQRTLSHLRIKQISKNISSIMEKKIQKLT